MEHDPATRLSMDDVVAYLRSGPQAVDAVGTQVLPAIPPVPPIPHSSPPAPPTDSRRSSGLRAAVAGLAALAVLAVVGVVLLISNDDDEPGGAGADSSVQTSDASADDETNDETGAPPPPSVEELESFATSYVETAADDPNAGFAMLTADYQARSPEYADFWGSVSNPEILNVKADPDGLTVTYTYKYDFAGSGSQTERVTLFLVQDGEQLLIDDAG